MTLTILMQQWKAFWRGRNAGKNLAMQLFIGFLILYMLASCLMAGIFLPQILRNSFPRQDIVSLLCSIFLYYFLAELALRYLIQELPALAVQPYLTLNIRRRQIVRFLNIRSLFHFINLLPVILFFPFIFETIAPTMGVSAAWALALSIIFLTLANHYLLLYIKRKTIINTWWLIGFLVAFAILISLDALHWLPIRQLSSTAFLAILGSPVWALAPAAILILAFALNNRFLMNNLYVEELAKGRKARRSVDYGWLRQLGTKGELIGLDLKLILRSKRPRYSFIVSLLVPAYGGIVFRPELMAAGNLIMPVFGSLLITGAFITNYGQWLFGWQSIHFDGLLAANIDLATYIRSKLVLFTTVSTYAFIVSTFFGLIDWHFVPILAAGWIYNVGVNGVLVVWIATYKYDGVDLNAGHLSFQGMSAKMVINMMVVLVLPLVIFGVFDLFDLPWTGIAVMGVLGMLSLVLRNWWVHFLVLEFNKRKYLILEGFRGTKH